jgi:TorA maturation chaperone TorD
MVNGSVHWRTVKIMEAEQVLQELASIAQARADFTSFLGIHFMTLPDVNFVKQMRDKEIASMLRALIRDESVEEDIASGAFLMYNFLEATRTDKLAQLAERLGVDRTRLYRGVSTIYGPPPPYELVWSKTFQEISLLQILAGVYREMGLEQSSAAKDRLDYIGMELEFLHELAAREAADWEAGETKNARSLLEAQRQFFFEHMHQWVLDFVPKALTYAETDFYKGHLMMLRGFVRDEAQELASLAEQAM